MSSVVIVLCLEVTLLTKRETVFQLNDGHPIDLHQISPIVDLSDKKDIN